MAIAHPWEIFNLKQNEYGQMMTFYLRDWNVVNNEMLNMILSKDVLSTSWVRIDGLKPKMDLLYAVQ